MADYWKHQDVIVTVSYPVLFFAIWITRTFMSQDPILRGYSSMTGCHLYYTPPKWGVSIHGNTPSAAEKGMKPTNEQILTMWEANQGSDGWRCAVVCLCLESHLLASWNVRYLPKDIGQQYYGNKSAFTFLRDPQLSLADIGPVCLLGNRELSLTGDLTHKNPCLHVRYDRAVNDFRAQAPLLDAVCAHNRPLFCDFAWNTTIFIPLQTNDDKRLQDS